MDFGRRHININPSFNGRPRTPTIPTPFLTLARRLGQNRELVEPTKVGQKHKPKLYFWGPLTYLVVILGGKTINPKTRTKNIAPTGGYMLKKHKPFRAMDFGRRHINITPSFNGRPRTPTNPTPLLTLARRVGQKHEPFRHNDGGPKT